MQGVLHAVNQHDPWMATGESIHMLEERSTMDLGVVQKMFQKKPIGFCDFFNGFSCIYYKLYMYILIACSAV